MKTPMQELLDILIEKKCNTFEAPLSDTRVALDFAIEQTRLMLEKEKDVMLQYGNDICCPHHGDENDALYVWNQTFNTKEK